jgi:SAM-dependent methyltransferase
MVDFATEEEVLAGIQWFNRLFILTYKPNIWGFHAHLIWHCTKPRIVSFEEQYLSDRHLDIGVGNGELLSTCRFPSARPNITLLDLSPVSLGAAARTLARYQPRAVQADCLQPLPLEPASFDSIGLIHMIHCLPGTMEQKAVVFDNCLRVLAPDGVVFGCIIMGQGVRHNWLSRGLLRAYNWRRIMTNLNDSVDDLDQALEARFSRHKVDVVGSVAFFTAWA